MDDLGNIEATLAALDGSSDVEIASAIDGNAIQFERALIKYATFSCRMLFVERVDIWKEFHAANSENCANYENYTPEQLCAYFLEQVLPRVYQHELTALEKHIFDLLKLHPEFERTEHGFRRMPPEKRILYSRQPVAGQDFHLVTQPQNEREWFNVSPTADTNGESEVDKFELPQTSTATHTLVTTVPYENQRVGYDFQFSTENAALISAALSNDFELSGCVLLEPREMHKRLLEAKRNFEQHARMPENCMDAKKLIEKLVKLKKLRESIVDVVSNCF